MLQRKNLTYTFIFIYTQYYALNISGAFVYAVAAVAAADVIRLSIVYVM